MANRTVYLGPWEESKDEYDPMFPGGDCWARPVLYSSGFAVNKGIIRRPQIMHMDGDMFCIENGLHVVNSGTLSDMMIASDKWLVEDGFYGRDVSVVFLTNEQWQKIAALS